MVRKPPTMRDVATRAGVSTATVSNVLGQRKPVDPALAERVRRAAAELDYHVDRAASLLRTGRAQVIAILVPSIENPYFTALIAAIERAVRLEGFDIIVASGNDEDAAERARLAALLSWKPAGVVVVPSTDAFAGRDLLDFADVPYVVVDRVPDEPGADAITVDNEAAAGDAARHLLALGHDKILVVASSLALANIRERCEGVRRATRTAGSPPPAVLEVGMSFEEIGGRVERCFAVHGRPTGIIALTNFATLGVIASLGRLGLKVPDDLSLVGFDDYTWMRVSTPPITAVAQPVERMAAAAWARLADRIAGEEHAPARLKLPCRLEIRKSTRSVGPSLIKDEAGADEARPHDGERLIMALGFGGGC